MTESEAKLCIRGVLKDHPKLNAEGLWRISIPGRNEPIAPQEFIRCVEWLLENDALDRRQTINHKLNSYTFKHVVETATGRYISNGAFICAALYLNYKMRLCGHSPNPYFNVKTPRG